MAYTGREMKANSAIEIFGIVSEDAEESLSDS